MLISEFARATGLTADTVRFYVRRGLLRPETNGLGGRHPYQVFTDEHVRAARIIRLAKSLGFSLRDVARLDGEYQAGEMTPTRVVEVLSAQLARLEEKAAELGTLRTYLRAKIAWIEGGACGAEPELGRSGGAASRPGRAAAG